MVTQGVSIKLQELAAETGWLRRLARSLVQDAAAAEDLVHDTYVAQLWVHHDSLSSWGYSLARRYFTDEHGTFVLDIPRGAFRISVRRSFEDDFLDQDDVVLRGGTRDARIVLP